ncbi:inner membrane peptidase, Serine peptidase, MEROPS family S49 [Psychrobacter arcticus 273-4]|uniref:Inner membrane peptidase, Serine peptidase, MEROPS family S49 n=1 Tax=Psychrobacter arcticus (strain DSM 17307 / VKM B-2377 / 273-4) TaxID=259536 RepID=Q4FSF5_PSYA2|nr:protease SohB [Psychrobacter arcticus]AAZ19053.1 inner membrane peptidase, Serine peptidase, MEROPS family S49 [Psychrobacter arcticus 273-4]
MLFNPSKNPVELRVIHLNKNQEQRREDLMEATQGKAALKQFKKTLAKKAKQALKTKNKKKNSDSKQQIFVLDFDGDIKATAVKHLREEISTLISTANKGDEVVVRLESGGGVVHGYGLAAAQLARLKDAGLKLTVCVDKVAASGGYMMACVADNIVAAPFAIIGSIGVVSQLPNFHKWLKNHDVDYEMFTAGDYKRTVTVFGENDDKDRAKYQEELEQTHELFKHFVNRYRGMLDVDKVATGEHWYGEDALHLNLVDKLQTSDSYLLERMENSEVYALHSRQKPTLAEKLGLSQAAEATLSMAIDKLPDALARFDFNSRLNILK